ncbi:DMT family transporter [Lentibacter algarum]|uniref:DMT family transporter n=1 Tax=Lentibacter algarum TaxID=576131 RepID=UPI00339DA2A5
MRQADNKLGAGLMVASMAGFALEDVFFKSATQTAQVGPSLITFGALGLLLFAGYSLLRQEAVFHSAVFHRSQLIRSAFELMGRLFYGLALAYAPLASTSAILQATPIVVTIGAVFVFGEVVGWRRWAAMFVGLVGVLIILRPGIGGFELTSLFAVLGMLGFAGRDLATRASPASMTMAQLGTLGFSVLVLAGAILTILEGVPPALPAGVPLLKLIAAALVGVFAYSALNAAMRVGDVGFVAPFRYTRLVFALILAVTLFGERPDGFVLLGAVVIVAAGLYSFLRDRALKSPH